MESTICNKNHSFYCTRRILAGAFTIFVKVKKALAAALSSYSHVWTGSARTIHMNEIKPKSTFPNKGAL